MSEWPRYRELTLSQVKYLLKNDYINGVGASWWPERARRIVTRVSKKFFKEASWGYHDYGYVVGGNEFDRWRCDWRFFKAMIRDSFKSGWLVVPGIFLSILFYISVALIGFTAFRYGHNEILDGLRDE